MESVIALMAVVILDVPLRLAVTIVYLRCRNKEMRPSQRKTARSKQSGPGTAQENPSYFAWKKYVRNAGTISLWRLLDILVVVPSIKASNLVGL
jgi:hypothetical protein